MKYSLLLNAIGLIIGFVGALIFWLVGRREGTSLPFYPDSEGKILAEIKAKSEEDDSRKNLGIALIAISFLCQFLALFF